MNNTQQPMTQYEYLAAQGIQCPACRSREIDGMDVDMDGDGIVQSCECNACGATWTDQYTLVGYIELEVEK